MENTKIILYQKSKAHIIAYFACLLVAVGLLIASFVIPPTGVIDGSVLKAVALLLGFYLAYDFPHVLASLKTFKLSKGDIVLEGTTRKKGEADAEEVERS